MGHFSTSSFVYPETEVQSGTLSTRGAKLRLLMKRDEKSWFVIRPLVKEIKPKTNYC